MKRCVFVCAALFAMPARAQPDAAQEEQYRTLVLQGIEEYDRHAYEESRASFEQALALRRSARVLRGLGKALFELRRYSLSTAAFDEALSTEIDPLPPELRDEVQALRDRARGYVGTMTIRVAQADATILVDGAIAQPGVEIPLDVGAHIVEISAPRFRPQRRTVAIEGAHAQTLEVSLEDETALTVVNVSGRPADDAPWVVSGVALIAAGAIGAIASSAWFAERDSAVGACVRAALRGASCDNAGAIALERDLALWSIAIAGGAALAGGTVLIAGLLLRSPAPPVACAPAPDGLACSARIAF